MSSPNILDNLTPHMAAARQVAANLVGQQDADDVVQDAILAIAGRADREGVDEEINWLALFLRYTQWAGLDWLKKRDEIEAHEVEGAGLLAPEGDSDEDLAERSYVQHRTTPAWPTAIEQTTPEDIVTAAQLRDLIREIAVTRHGPRAYAVFGAVVMDGESQGKVAREHDLTQSRVSQIVNDVRETLREELTKKSFVIG